MAAKKEPSLEEMLLKISEGISEGSWAPNIKKYKPHEKQYRFHSSTKKKKLYIGGNRSGKTTGGVCEGIWRATSRHPYRPELNKLGPTRGRVVGVDFTQGIEKIILPQYKQWLYPSALIDGSWERSYHKSLRTLTFANGSTIEFLSYDQDLDKHAGTSRHWIHFDEEPPEPIYIENMARLIDTDGEFWITMTPVEGMTWIYDELYEPNHELPHDEQTVEIIEIETQENPFLSESAIASFSGSVKEDDSKTRIQGKFVTTGGRVYPEFDPEESGPHVIPPVGNPREYFKKHFVICSLDHGLNNPTSVHLTGWDEQGYGITFAEHYRAQWSVEQHAEAIHSMLRVKLGRMPDLLVADPSIVNRNAVTMTSIQQEYAKYGLPFTPGNNDIKAGIFKFRSYLREVQTGKAEPKSLWRITADCEKAIWEMKRYRYKVYAQKKLRSENNPYEVPHPKNDHSMDELRYMIMTRPDLVADSENLAEQLQDAMKNFNFSRSAEREPIADPNDLRENPNWSELNSVPSGFSGSWDYDEHMGGLY